MRRVFRKHHLGELAATHVPETRRRLRLAPASGQNCERGSGAKCPSKCPDRPERTLAASRAGTFYWSSQVSTLESTLKSQPLHCSVSSPFPSATKQLLPQLSCSSFPPLLPLLLLRLSRRQLLRTSGGFLVLLLLLLRLLWRRVGRKLGPTPTPRRRNTRPATRSPQDSGPRPGLHPAREVGCRHVR